MTVTINGTTGLATDSATADVDGFAQLSVSNDGAAAIIADRTTSDGTIIDVQKDGSSVGSIGVLASRLSIGTGDTGLFFNDQTDQIQPFNTSTNSARDAVISLGTTDRRFNNLYLSGGVVFGDAGGSGTPSSNTLDSYEEGTWTPTITGGASSVSYSIQVGYYIKVGGLVNFGLDLDAASATANSNNIEISGLPFTSNPSTSKYYSAAVVSYTSGFIDGPSRGVFHISHNTTAIKLYDYAGNPVAGNATGINMSNRIILTGTYNTL